MTTASPSTIELRPYQSHDLDRLRQAATQHGTVVYQCATGSGKTVTAGAIARGGADQGNRTLFLVHRRELVTQTVKTLTQFCPDLDIGVEAAGWPKTPWADLYVGMVQSIHRRKQLSWTREPNLIIIDEAHHARAKTWEQVLNRWPDAYRVGLTATPERLDGKGLGEHFAKMVNGPSIPQLVADGYLAPTRTLTLPTTVKFSKRRADMDAQVNSKVVADAVTAYERYAPGRPAIFFGINRDHSRQVAAGLRKRGWRAAHVDGTDHPARRDKVMNDFKTGGLDVVCNCQLISEGFDAPACEVVMMGSPTRSVTMYLQQGGRSMRPGPDKEALILDLVGNSHHLGLVDDPREWSLSDGEIVRAGTKRQQKPRPCPACRTAYRGTVCPHCGHRRAAAAKIDTVDTELVDARHQQQTARRQAKLSRQELNTVLRQCRAADDPEAALKAVCKEHGYKPAWVYYILRSWGLK